MRRQSVGVSLAWLAIILLFPFLGAAVYFFIGEKRLGHYRAIWAEAIEQQFEAWRNELMKFEFHHWPEGHSDARQLAQLVTRNTNMPPLAGNGLQLMDSPEHIFRSLIKDIESAQHSCHMEYYIWEVGGLASDVSSAMSDAAKRGIDCRILVDAVGSRGFLRSRQCTELRSVGVQIREALPSSLFRTLFYRFDLRLHRKVVVIDNRIAYVGSQNMADPKKFQAGAGFGQWIDAMARLSGPAVDALAMTFYMDWQLESFDRKSVDYSHHVDRLDDLCDQTAAADSAVQVVPSGPGTSSKVINQTLLNAIYMADHRLSLTTPYFVPDESLQIALLSAADRGVDVTIIVPERVNSVFVRLASRAFLRDLAESGVKVAHYQAGMLHTKSVVVDEDVCMFGSLNLDPRSLHLNFEITLMVYDQLFTQSVLELQTHYLSDSRVVNAADLTVHSFPIRVLENCVRLLAPLL